MDVRGHVYVPRHWSPIVGGSDADGLKLYSVSLTAAPVDTAPFKAKLDALKGSLDVPWSRTAAFAIFHRGADLDYLVLCWWGNDNELFVRVAVREGGEWTSDPERYSFCLWDMEIMWLERRSYIRWMYSGNADLEAYRSDMVAPAAMENGNA